jgi:hypothetical protein
VLTLGVKVAASTVWQILREAGLRTWASFLRSQATALLAADFIEAVTLTGTWMGDHGAVGMADYVDAVDPEVPRGPP